MKVLRYFLGIAFFFTAILFVLSPLLACGETNLPEKRTSGQHVYDSARLLKVLPESIEQLLTHFNTQFGTEVIIATVADLDREDITISAHRLFTKWEIGKTNSAKGILVLIAKAQQQVKVEVGFGSEGVFTDLFCGYIERKQLLPYVLNNQLDAGLAALVEELISRASGKLTDDSLRVKLYGASGALSGGAGIKKTLPLENNNPERNNTFQDKSERTFKSPDEVWQGYVADLKTCTTSLDLYTPLSQMVWEYSRAMTPEICEMLYRGHSGTVQIFRDGPFAVAFVPSAANLGARFLALTDKGWKLDMWSTRKWIHFDVAQSWNLLGVKHPYLFAFRQQPLKKYLSNLDFHDDFGLLAGELLSQVPATKEGFKSLIAKLETAISSTPNSASALAKLGEVYFDLGADFKSAELFQRALTINPDEANALRGLGLLYRDTLISKDSAIKHLENYARVKPNEAAAHHYLAIAYMRRGISPTGDKNAFKNAIREMEKFISLSPIESHAGGYYSIAFYYGRLGDKQGETVAIKKLLELYPFDRNYQDRLIQAGGMAAWNEFLIAANNRGALLLQTNSYGSQVVVANVGAGGPAEIAGIQRGDIVKTYNGKPVESSAQLISLIGQSMPGTPVPLEIIRNNKIEIVKPIPLSLGQVLQVNSQRQR